MVIKRSTSLLLLWSLGLLVYAQPATEVYIMDLTLGPLISLGTPLNISQHAGYDNQPHFLANGDLLYTSQHEDQTEVMKYNISTGENKKITDSPGGEYSPTPLGDGQHFSTIVLEKSGRQLLWKYRLDGSEPQVLVPDLKIGYHCWLNDQLIASFVLGDPPTLQLCYLQSGKNQVIASNIGRSLHKIPESDKLSYLDKSQEPWKIMSYHPQTGAMEFLLLALSGVEDLTWSPDGTLFMAQDSKLYAWRLGDKDWTLVADLAAHGIRNITRLAVDANGAKLALVAAE